MSSPPPPPPPHVYLTDKLSSILTISAIVARELHEFEKVHNVSPYIDYVSAVWCFTPYQQYFSYLMATVHKSMFPGL